MGAGRGHGHVRGLGGGRRRRPGGRLRGRRGDELDALYLLADVLRQGIGTALLGTAKAHRPDGLTLAVFQRNTRARAFYTRHGFTVVDSNDGSRNMENEPDLTMRWQPVTNSTRTDG